MKDVIVENQGQGLNPGRDRVFKKKILEKFTEDSDPISDMGIGMIREIKKFIQEIDHFYVDKKEQWLWICAKDNKVEFVKYLLEKGADVHVKEDHALIQASYRGHTEIVKLLLDAGADVRTNNDEAIGHASYYGYKEIVKLLLDAGANVHARDDYALRWACEKGHLDIVKMLLDAGANVHSQNDWSLRAACMNDNSLIVKLLLDAGANVHANYNQPMRLAKERGHEDVVKILQDHIDKENKGIVKESLLEKFTEDSDPIFDMGIGMISKIKKFVKEQGWNYNLDDALWICAEEGKLNFVKFLLDKGADVHVDNDASLRWASHNGYKRILELLLKHGADVHAKDDNALVSASANGHKKIIELLLKHGANVHAQNDAALRWTSADGHREIVELLLQHGADVHADDDYALQWAKYYGHKDVVKVLKDHINKKKKGLIKESLLEKFIEDSDPIRDMGIGGLYKGRDFKDMSLLIDILILHIPSILQTKEIPEDILSIKGYYINPIYFSKIRMFLIEKYITLNMIDITEQNEWVTTLRRKLLDKGFKPAEYYTEDKKINEKFTEDSDPITDMGIGLASLIFNRTQWAWAKRWNIYSDKDWMDIIKYLLNKKYTQFEIECVLHSSIMRYTNDNSGRDKSNLRDFIIYNERSIFPNKKYKSEVDIFLENDVYRSKEREYDWKSYLQLLD